MTMQTQYQLRPDRTLADVIASAESEAARTGQPHAVLRDAYLDGRPLWIELDALSRHTIYADLRDDLIVYRTTGWPA